MSGPVESPSTAVPTVDVRGLCKRFGRNEVLKGIDFHVDRREVVVVLGPSGSGKSTLLRCVNLLEIPDSGEVLIDGVDICDMKLRDLRTILGYAQQDAFLFSTTVSRNIAFALDDPDAPEAIERVRDAAREAQVLEEAMSLPEGFDTVVGERGVQLSGGQRQRIALARALIWEPRILLLDDPLSAVDAKTEASILEAIERQTKKRTVILVTHRVAAASKCDAIVVLDQGKVVDHGTHAELVTRPGIYRDFADEQRALRELEAIDENSGGEASAAGTSAEVGA